MTPATKCQCLLLHLIGEWVVAITALRRPTCHLADYPSSLIFTACAVRPEPSQSTAGLPSSLPPVIYPTMGTGEYPEFSPAPLILHCRASVGSDGTPPPWFYIAVQPKSYAEWAPLLWPLLLGHKAMGHAWSAVVGHASLRCSWVVADSASWPWNIFYFLNRFKSLQSSKKFIELVCTQKNMKKNSLDISWSFIGLKNMNEIYLALGLSV
jgi:hypothetical protein